MDKRQLSQELKRRKLFNFAIHGDLDRVYGVAYLTPQERAAMDVAIKTLEEADAKAPNFGKSLALFLAILGGLASIIAIGEGAVAAWHHIISHQSTHSSQNIRQQTASTNTQAGDQVTYLDIKEWGVKLPLSNTIKDAYYVDAGSSDDEDGLPSTLSLGLTSLNAACGTAVPRSWDVMQHALVEMIRTLPTDTDPVSGKLYSQLDPVGATVGGYYIGLADVGLKDGRVCLSPGEAQAIDAAFVAAIKNMVPNGVAWKAYNTGSGGVRFLYPADWMATKGIGQSAVADATSPAFTTGSVTTSSNPNAPINLYLQLSTDSSTIDCASAPCQVSGVVPLNNPQLPHAVLAIVNQTSNNGTKFTEYVIADAATKVGDTSISPVTFKVGNENAYVFGQPYYLPSNGGLTIAAQVTDSAAFMEGNHFQDLMTLINSIE